MTDRQAVAVERVKAYFAAAPRRVIDLWMPGQPGGWRGGWVGGKPSDVTFGLDSISARPGELFMDFGEGCSLTVRGKDASLRRVVNANGPPFGTVIEISGFTELIFDGGPEMGIITRDQGVAFLKGR